MASAWYYNSNSGLISHSNTVIMYPDLHFGFGWHGPFASKQAAVDYYDQNKGKNPGWKAPSDSLAQRTKNLAGTAATDAGLPTVADVYKNLNLGGWVLRIGEILFGLVLVGVGVAKLTGTTNVISKAVKAKI